MVTLLFTLLPLLLLQGLAVCEPPPPNVAEQRRVFMWSWGTQTEVLTNAALAAAHRSSITATCPSVAVPKEVFK